MDGWIVECELNFLTLEHAKRLVPPEFQVAWKWFCDHEEEHLSRLPMGDATPDLGVPITLARQSGIHSPDYRKFPSCADCMKKQMKKYVLSIHSEGSAKDPRSPYPDKDLIGNPDGTWTFEYSEHREKRPGIKRIARNFNSDMMNNLHDGIPVGVLIRQKRGGYLNLGLAYVERYDEATGLFTLHGPVSAEASNPYLFSLTSTENLSASELETLKKADLEDTREAVQATVIRRKQQYDFRKKLLDAYAGRCAATDVGIPDVLQAAHIVSYRGARTQKTRNGILLRSDIHLLYDANLLTIEPEDYRIRTSSRLEGSIYERLEGRQIHLPQDKALWPQDDLLELHGEEFWVTESHCA